jgi:hypothetical protein
VFPLSDQVEPAGPPADNRANSSTSALWEAAGMAAQLTTAVDNLSRMVNDWPAKPHRR